MYSYRKQNSVSEMNLLSYENTSNSLKSLNEEIFVPDVSTVVHNLLKYSKFGGNEQRRLCQIHGMRNVLVYLRSDNKFVLASNYLITTPISCDYGTQTWNFWLEFGLGTETSNLNRYYTTHTLDI